MLDLGVSGSVWMHQVFTVSSRRQMHQLVLSQKLAILFECQHPLGLCQQMSTRDQRVDGIDRYADIKNFTTKQS